MTLGEKAVQIAITQEGVTEHPPGSNRGPSVDSYLRSVGLDPTHGKFAWCAAFVSWCILAATKVVGGPPQFRGTAGALRLLALNPGLVIPNPEPFCIAVEDHSEGKGHAYFVVANDNGVLRTLEGNTDANGSRTGGQVMRRTRLAANCKGFLRIA